MKIAWVTPYSQKSTIGRFSAWVSAALAARGHEMTLVASDQDMEAPSARPPDEIKLVQWNRFENDPLAASAFDLFVYNIGDNFPDHFGVLQLIDRYPMVGIFHDFSLVNLFLSWRDSVNPSIADKVLSSNYGAEMAKQFWDKVKETNFGDPKEYLEFLDWSASRSPMTEWLARKSIAAVAHAEFYESRLARSCPGPVSLIPLAFKNAVTETSAIRIEHRDNRVRILSIARSNLNTRVESVIRAIANLPALRLACIYNVAGPIEPSSRTRIQSLIDESDLRESVHLLGEISDFELHHRFAEADIVCCLRWPVLEGASTSCVRAMFYGKPVIVTDAGFSGSIPSDCVLKVRPPHEAEDLTQHLETLVTNHTGRETLGKSAQRWADAEHAPEVYASRIEPLLAAAAEGRPLFDALNQISSTLHLMGVGYRDPLAEQIGSEFQRLFLGEKPENTRLHPTADCIQPTAAICNVLRESETDPSTGRSTGQVEPTDLPGDSRRRSEGDLQKRSLHTRAGQLMWRFGVRCTEPILSRLRGYLVEPLYNLGSSSEQRLSTIEQSIGNVRQVISDVEESINHSKRSINHVKQAVSGLATNLDSLQSRVDDSQRLIALLVNRNILVLGNELLARTPYGYILGPADDAAFACILAEGGKWELATSKLLDLMLRDGMTFVDIGAHVGLHTVHAGRLVGPHGVVIAFEPTPTAFHLLERSVRLNGLQKVCRCMNIAVSSTEGAATLHVSDIYGHNSLYPLVDEKAELQVKTCTLDKLLRDARSPDIVKIDVEGAELEVLEGMQYIVANHQNIVLIVEFGVPHLERNGVTSLQWFDRFFAQGFDVFALDEQAASWRQVAKENAPRLPSTNLVFVRPNTEPWILLKKHET